MELFFSLGPLLGGEQVSSCLEDFTTTDLLNIMG